MSRTSSLSEGGSPELWSKFVEPHFAPGIVAQERSRALAPYIATALERAYAESVEMPEGHVIHGIAAALTELFSGQIVYALSPQGGFDAGAVLIDGCRFASAIAHGKHLFGRFDPEVGDPHVLHVHLGLYGVWSFAVPAGHPLASGRNPLLTAAAEGTEPGTIGRGPDFAVPAPRGAVRLRLLGEQAVADLNGPSQCVVRTIAEVEAVRARLGPDPLLDNSNPAEFVRAIRSSRRVIGELLMDQRVVSGVGNIYRAELLLRHHINPVTPGQRLSIRKLEQLWADAVILLAEGKRTGVIVTTEPEHIEKPSRTWTRLAERATDEEADLRWYAYRRSGRPCHRCHAPIATSTLSNRTVYWCPRCQRSPRI